MSKTEVRHARTRYRETSAATTMPAQYKFGLLSRLHPTQPAVYSLTDDILTMLLISSLYRVSVYPRAVSKLHPRGSSARVIVAVGVMPIARFSAVSVHVPPNLHPPWTLASTDLRLRTPLCTCTQPCMAHVDYNPVHEQVYYNPLHPVFFGVPTTPYYSSGAYRARFAPPYAVGGRTMHLPSSAPLQNGATATSSAYRCEVVAQTMRTCVCRPVRLPGVLPHQLLSRVRLTASHASAIPLIHG